MHKKLIQEIWEYFKDNYEYEINSPTDFFEKQRDLLEFLMCLGRDLEQPLIDNIGTGYKGIIIRNNGKDFKFKGNRKQGVGIYFVGKNKFQRETSYCSSTGRRNAKVAEEFAEIAEFLKYY